MQPEPRVLGARRRLLQVRGRDRSHLAGHPAYVVGAGQRGELVGRCRTVRLTEGGGREPQVEHGPALVERRDPVSPGCRRRVAHGRDSTAATTFRAVAPQFSANWHWGSSRPVLGWGDSGLAGGRSSHVTGIRERLGAATLPRPAAGVTRARRSSSACSARWRSSPWCPWSTRPAGKPLLSLTFIVAAARDVRRDAQARPRALRAVRRRLPAQPRPGGRDLQPPARDRPPHGRQARSPRGTSSRSWWRACCRSSRRTASASRRCCCGSRRWRAWSTSCRAASAPAAAAVVPPVRPQGRHRQDRDPGADAARLRGADPAYWPPTGRSGRR